MTPEALKADHLIATEIAKQDRLWGENNERADSTQGQLFDAAQAQLVMLSFKVQDGMSSEDALAEAAHFYPEGWSGFRDYGSDVANLVVAAAFIRQEIKRKLSNGESDYRAPRDHTTHPYNPATGLPYGKE